jgi:hypothetical protein
VSDETIAEALHQSELTLSGLLALIGSQVNSNGEDASAEYRRIPAKNMSHGVQLATTQNAFEDELSRPYNQRIPLPGDGLLPDDLEGDDIPLDENDDALSRDRVKMASKQVNYGARYQRGIYFSLGHFGPRQEEKADAEKSFIT